MTRRPASSRLRSRRSHPGVIAGPWTRPPRRHAQPVRAFLSRALNPATYLRGVLGVMVVAAAFALVDPPAINAAFDSVMRRLQQPPSAGRDLRNAPPDAAASGLPRVRRGATVLTGCRLLSVADGDTFSARCPGLQTERIRIAGIDTPELSAPQCPAERADALAARNALSGLLGDGRALRIEPREIDLYGRLVADVSVGNQRIDAAMIALGHARPYDGGARQGWCD